MKEKCLILGGCGFMGSHVADILLSHDYSLRIFDKINVSTANIDHLIDDIELIEGDFTNKLDVTKAIKDVDYIIHMISSTLPQTSLDNPLYDIEANIVSTVHLLEQVSKIKRIKKIIFSSSGGTVYGIPETIPIDENHANFPICPYGISKLTIEKYLYYFHKIFNLNYISLRISNPYGERQNIHGIQGAISVFLGKILEKKKIKIWGDGEVARDYIYIKDVANAFLKALENSNFNSIYNVGSGKSVTLNKIIELLEIVTHRKAKVQYVKSRKFDIPVNALKINKIKKELAWKPEVSLKEGIELTWNFLKDKRV